MFPFFLLCLDLLGANSLPDTGLCCLPFLFWFYMGVFSFSYLHVFCAWVLVFFSLFFVALALPSIFYWLESFYSSHTELPTIEFSFGLVASFLLGMRGIVCPCFFSQNFETPFIWDVPVFFLWISL